MNKLSWKSITILFKFLFMVLITLNSCTTTIEEPEKEDLSVHPEEPKEPRTTVEINWAGKPKEMYLSDDGRRLITGGKNYAGLYDSAAIRTLYLTFKQPDYWSIMQSNYSTKTDLAATLVVDGRTYENVGVRFKGETSYREVYRYSKKLSFNISMRYIPDNPKLMGYRTLNLNNAFQDPSFLREVYYLYQIRKHIPAAKANFVQLYINGESWGLYPNIQQLNKDFLVEWFFSDDGGNWRAEGISSGGMPLPGGGGGWGNGKSALNYLGDNIALYQANYTLKSSDIDDHWERLTAACKVLNTTPADLMTREIPKYFDVDRVLWFLACEIAFADDDSYVWKGQQDYYVYYEPETERITPIEFDGNSVMKMNNVNWSPFMNENKVNYPLLNKLLAVPQYRQRYLAHLRTIIDELFDIPSTNRIIDNYRSQIDALVEYDPKKLSTYNQFINEIGVLKNFISTRRNNLLSNPEVAQKAPVIHEVVYRNADGVAWAAPLANQEVNVTAKVTSVSGINRVNLYYSTSLAGNFSVITMEDDGKHGDGAANDGIFGTKLQGSPAGTFVRFYVEAVANNAALSVSYNPAGAEHDVYFFQVKAE